MRPRLALVGLLVGHTIAQAGNAITVFATPFYVRSIGGSATDIGVAAAAATVPIILGGPLSGVLVDRIGYRRSSIAADIVSGLTVLAIAVLGTTGTLPFWGLLGLLFLSGLFDTPGQTARTVLLPTLARATGTPLERVVGLAEGVSRAALLVGAPLGGLLVATLGPAEAFFVNTVFFIASAGVVALLVPSHTRTAPDLAASEPVPAPSGYWRDLVDGVAFVVRQPLIRNIALVVLLLNALDAARFSVLLPVYATDQLGGAAAAGLIMGALAGGSILGAALFSTWGHRLPRRALFVIAFALTGAPLSLAFVLQAPLFLLITLSALTGVAAGNLNPLIGTMRLELTPPPMLARVQTLSIAIAWAGVPAGSLLGGLAADRFDLPVVFAVIGVVYVLIALTPLVGGSWRQMNHRPSPARTDAALR